MNNYIQNIRSKLEKLTELFNNGGAGRLGDDLTLTNDLTLSKSVNLIGNSNAINMNDCKIIIPSDLTFKAQNTDFNNGVNSFE